MRSAGRAPGGSRGRRRWRRPDWDCGRTRVVGEQRRGHSLGEAAEFVGAFESFREDRVGAGGQVQLGPANGVVEPCDAAGIGAGDDDETWILPRRHGRAKPGDHSLRVNQALAGEMAATLGELLIFEVQPRGAGVFKESHGAFDVERLAEASVGIAQERSVVA